MLHHEEPENVITPPAQDAGLPASEVRVTAEEFARAVARHQARREEAARHLEGTLSLGDAVQELNIDITPEELLAEVQAARAEQQAVRTPQSRRRPRWGLAAASAGLLALFSAGLHQMRIQSPGDSVATLSPAVGHITTPGAPSVVPMTAPGTILVQDARGVLCTLQEIPNDAPVRCGLTQTDGRAAFVDFPSPDSAWTLIKHDGHLYVRGWIADMSAQAIQVSGVTLYDTRALVPAGAAPRAVALRLDGIQALPMQGDDEMIVAQKVRPDAHFGDRW